MPKVIKEINKYMSLEFAFIRFTLIELMQYKINFFIRSIYELMETATTLLYFCIVLGKVGNIAGWSIGQLVFITIYAFLIDSLCTLLFIGGMSSIPPQIEEGKFDLMLLKPINTQYYIFFHRPNPAQIFNTIIGIVGLIFTTVYYHISQDIYSVFLFVVSTLSSMVIMYCVLSIIIHLSFWFIRIGNLWSIVFTFHMAATRPAAIYNKGMKIFMTLIIPSIVVLNVPVEIISNNKDNLLCYISLPVALVFLILNHVVSQAGLKRYTSAGS
ncbi:MAG: ABC-2 family transporter protein [Clostridium sp.]|jgi:ABC-2 type transport system permease protein|nr:ABC-2 family transporter protein [Clostridium sp.]